jgi:hydroxymethylbilane synthase
LASYGGGCHQKIGISILARDYGDITFLRGETDAGEILDRSELTGGESESAAMDAATAWPLPGDGSDSYGEGFYERRELKVDAAALRERTEGRGLWIARANALPDSVRIGPKVIVWTAGLTTWRKLARQGIWVNGSAEGLGEHEEPKIDVLAGEKVEWLKLTHTPVPGVAESPGIPGIPTYELVPRADIPNLAGKKDFFWMSGSAFVAALARYPEIRGARHSAGPGRTQETLRAVLGKSAKIGTELSYAAWLKRVRGIR